MSNCPNCRREFDAFTAGEYCPECWKAWGKSDGSFEARSRDMAAILRDQLARPRFKPCSPPPLKRMGGPDNG